MTAVTLAGAICLFVISGHDGLAILARIPDIKMIKVSLCEFLIWRRIAGIFLPWHDTNGLPTRVSFLQDESAI